MKKIIHILTVMLFITTFFSGCSKQEENNKKLSIVTTIFPEYDWLREITKGVETIELTFLLDDGIDLHNYNPAVSDVVTIKNSDLLVYVGGEADKYIEDILKDNENNNLVSINLLEVLGDAAKEEEYVEGMEKEEEESEEIELDDHVWLSLRNASILVEYIAEKLIEIDPDNKEIYEANTNSYISKLEELDKEYEIIINKSQIKTVLFGDRFPFRYLVDDYGLNYYAAFAGCSAESEASFDTVIFLANKLDELNLPTIFKIESGDGKIAQTIKETTKTKDQRIIGMDSMQSITNKDIESGIAYLEIMKANLKALEEGLNY